MPRFLQQSLALLSFLLSVSFLVAEGFTVPGKHHQLGLSTTTATTTASRIMTSRSIPSAFDYAGHVRGGVSTGTSSTSSSSSTQLLFAADPTESKCPVSKSMAVFGSIWGSLGVVYILAKAVKRVLPIALEPFTGKLTFGPIQWSCYALSCLFFAYAEGYKGFQLKFSPLVVKRSLSLVIGTRQGSVINYLLAPLYSMGLIHATKKRLITSWCVTLGVAAIVAIVKRLNPVARCILDAGVVVGLTWGSLSILAFFFRSISTGKPPAVDACLPVDSSKKE